MQHDKITRLFEPNYVTDIRLFNVRRFEFNLFFSISSSSFHTHNSHTFLDVKAPNLVGCSVLHTSVFFFTNPTLKLIFGIFQFSNLELWRIQKHWPWKLTRLQEYAIGEIGFEYFSRKINEIFFNFVIINQRSIF
jgi:hypothetical protein